MGLYIFGLDCFNYILYLWIKERRVIFFWFKLKMDMKNGLFENILNVKLILRKNMLF